MKSLALEDVFTTVLYSDWYFDYDLPFGKLHIGNLGRRPNLKIKAYIAPGEECPICLEEILHKSNAHLTLCGHAFHKTCFHELYRRSPGIDPSCPVCRDDLMYEELSETTYFSESGLDKLEDFWMNKDIAIPCPCLKYHRTDHFAGACKDCSGCLKWRRTGRYHN